MSDLGFIVLLIAIVSIFATALVWGTYVAYYYLFIKGSQYKTKKTNPLAEEKGEGEETIDDNNSKYS